MRRRREKVDRVLAVGQRLLGTHRPASGSNGTRGMFEATSMTVKAIAFPSGAIAGW